MFFICTCTISTYVFYQWMLKQNASAKSHKTAPADWAKHEFSLAPLPDQRHTKRLQMIATAFAQQPTASIPQACNSPAEVKATYRFVENEAIIPAAIREPHHQATLQRVCSHPIILAVQDTTTLNYSTHPCTEGLGPICHSRKPLGCICIRPWPLRPPASPWASCIIRFAHVPAHGSAVASGESSPPKKVINGSRVWRPAKLWRLGVRVHCWLISPTAKAIFMNCLSRH